MVGPPGAGKTMLARRLTTILPPMTPEEQDEVTALYSDARVPAPQERPFRAPHHTISTAAMVGGGIVPRPGEVSLAHRGVLFLDELPEFRRAVLESLRQPVDDGYVTITRTCRTATFPCRLLLVGAMNPCPCGWARVGDRCACTPQRLARYRSRLSGPLFDRFDIQAYLGPVPPSALTSAVPGESSAVVRARVVAARDRQRKRFARTGVTCNAEMNQALLERHCRLDADVRKYFRALAASAPLSGRTYTRLLRVARTVADLAGAEKVRSPHLGQATRYAMPE